MKYFGQLYHSVQNTHRDIAGNRIFTIVHVLTALLFIVSVGAILLRWNVLPAQVPLWYSRPWGADQLAHPLWLFILPSGMIFWYAVSYAIVLFQKNRYRVFSQTVFLASLVVSSLSTLTLLNILILIT